MEFNWSTFVLEIINFVVLVWILKHFLYRPVLDMIAQRRATIDQQMSQAEQQITHTDELKKQYQNRLSDWAVERQKALTELQHELEQERLVQLDRLRQELSEEQQKIRLANSRQDQQILREIELRALQQAAQFASRLLAEAAGPELQQRLFKIMLHDLKDLSTEHIHSLGKKWGEPPTSIQVSSAYPLTQDQQQQLQQELQRISGITVPLEYRQDASLQAGLTLTIGAWVLQLNVRDELRGFADLAADFASNTAVDVAVDINHADS